MNYVVIEINATVLYCCLRKYTVTVIVVRGIPLHSNHI